MTAGMQRFRAVGPRIIGCAVLGVTAAVLTGVTGGWRLAAPVGWSLAAAVFVVLTWLIVGRMDPRRTREHALQEDPTRRVSEAIVLIASVGSLAGVWEVLQAGSAHGGREVWAAALGVSSVALSWLSAHTVFALRYARLYYSPPEGGIDFDGEDDPSYVDFSYVAFTLGMTYQVSDTALRTRAMRATALRQALLSYLLGAVIIAATINLVVGLGTAKS